MISWVWVIPAFVSGVLTGMLIFRVQLYRKYGE